MRRKMLLIVMCLAIVLTVFGSGKLIYEYINDQALDNMVSKDDDDIIKEENDSNIAVERLEKLTAEENQELLDVYNVMKQSNPDFAGYLHIEGTELAYPVMYSPKDPEKYLNKDINGLECDGGLPFIDTRCSLNPDSDNVLIYGHNMKDGSMFSSLISYQDKSYYWTHPVIRFDKPGELREYRVMSVFYDRVYFADEKDVFKFYDFIDASDKDEFDKAVNSIIKKSVYNTNVTAEYGDKLITLVTCAYHTNNGRFVVVAVRNDE